MPDPHPMWYPHIRLVKYANPTDESPERIKILPLGSRCKPRARYWMVTQVQREMGVSEPTLYAWRNRFRAAGQTVPSNPENRSGENKLAVMIETAALNEQKLAMYCRRKGLHPEQIQS
jgi:hypothetical protein